MVWVLGTVPLKYMDFGNIWLASFYACKFHHSMAFINILPVYLPLHGNIRFKYIKEKNKEWFLLYGKYVGYHRTSTKEQHLGRGICEIKKYCNENGIKLYKDKVYTDQQTGKNFERPRYTMLKEEILEKGDCLIITETDRLGRDKKSTLKEIQWLKENGIRLMVLELPTTLTDTASMEDGTARIMAETINNIMIELYTSLAEAEMHKREKRQREGIEQKRLRGEWADYGRPRAMEIKEFSKKYKEAEENGITPFGIMRKLGLSKSTFYRYKKEYMETYGKNKA